MLALNIIALTDEEKAEMRDRPARPRDPGTHRGADAGAAVGTAEVRDDAVVGGVEVGRGVAVPARGRRRVRSGDGRDDRDRRGDPRGHRRQRPRGVMVEDDPGRALGERRAPLLLRARESRCRRRGCSSRGSATCSSATTALAWPWPGAGATCRAGSTSPTSASAAWTSPSRWPTTTWRVPRRRAARRAPGTLFVIEPDLDGADPLDVDAHGMDPVKVLALASRSAPVAADARGRLRAAGVTARGVHAS